MSEAILISIQPKWCKEIASGKKTIEVRKSRPKLKTPFKVYIYCTKNDKDGRVFFSKEVFDGEKGKWAIPHVGNGKVIGEFVCRGMMDGGSPLLPKQSCLTIDEILDYAKGKRIYGWRIADLKIYDKPKELGEFYKPLKYDNVDGGKVVHCGHYQGIETVDCCEYNDGDCSLKGCKVLRDLYKITRPPKSWCYVEEGAGNE